MTEKKLKTPVNEYQQFAPENAREFVTNLGYGATPDMYVSIIE